MGQFQEEVACPSLQVPKGVGVERVGQGSRAFGFLLSESMDRQQEAPKAVKPAAFRDRLAGGIESHITRVQGVHER